MYALTRSRTSHLSIVAALLVLGSVASCGGSSGVGSDSLPESNLTEPSWVIVESEDAAGDQWVGSTLTFTSQEKNGDSWELEGQFFWESETTASFGTELFRGTLFADRKLALRGYQLVNASGIGLATYDAQISEDGQRIENGSWSGSGVIPGQWSAERVTTSNLALGTTRSAIPGVLLTYWADGRISSESVFLDQRWAGLAMK